MISREKTTNLSNMNVISEHIHAATEVNRERNTALNKWMSTLMLDAVGEDSAARRDQWKITKFATTPLVSTFCPPYRAKHVDKECRCQRTW
jgi:hypothetical protein